MIAWLACSCAPSIKTQAWITAGGDFGAELEAEIGGQIGFWNVPLEGLAGWGTVVEMTLEIFGGTTISQVFDADSNHIGMVVALDVGLGAGVGAGLTYTWVFDAN